MRLAALRITLLGGVAIVTGLGAHSASAQNINSSNITLLERLVIGAGFEKVAIDTPQAVTVVTQEEIDKAQANTIGDVLDDAPGVTAIGSDRVLGESFNIRGIGSFAAADESKIIVNVDGTPKFYEQYRMGSFFSDPELYKSIEILRGPASSTLYGSGAFGGVINMTTKDASDFIKPDMNGAARIKGSYDSNGTGKLVSGLVASKLSDNIELLATGNFRAADDFVDGDGTIISGSAFTAWSGLLKSTAYFGDNDEQVLRLSYQRWQSDVDNQDYEQTGSGGFGTVDRNVVDQTATITYENPDSDNPWLDLNVALSYSDTLVEQRNAVPPFPSASLLFKDADYGYRTFQLKADNTIEWKGDSFENYLTIGTQLSTQTRSAALVAGGPIDFHPQGVENKVGLFAQNEFIWEDRLTLIGGMRADFTNQEPDAAISSAGTINAVALSPKMAALFELNEHISVFGSAAHTERQPTLDEFFSTGAAGGGAGRYPGGRTASLSLEQEKSNNFELGAALSGHDLLTSGDNASIKVTGFYNMLSNLITSNPDNNNAAAVPYYVNINKARIYGIEVEGAYDSEYVFSRLAYSQVYGYDDATGLSLNSIPAHKLVATLGGRLPEYDLEFGWKATFATDTTFGSSGGTDAWQTHGIFASWTPEDGPLGGTEARLSVENIFDASYQDNLAGDKGRGRTFKLTLAKQFDY